MRLPAAMLARSGPLPADRGWSYEVKWDGFRPGARTYTHVVVDEVEVRYSELLASV